jgi:hypothetical protein
VGITIKRTQTFIRRIDVSYSGAFSMAKKKAAKPASPKPVRLSKKFEFSNLFFYDAAGSRRETI